MTEKDARAAELLDLIRARPEVAALRRWTPPTNSPQFERWYVTLRGVSSSTDRRTSVYASGDVLTVVNIAGRRNTIGFEADRRPLTDAVQAAGFTVKFEIGGPSKAG